MPAAPQNTAAGGGGGSGAGAHPRARKKRQVPLPRRPFGLEVGQGDGEGGGRCSHASGGSFKHPELIEQAPSGQCQPAPSPSSSPHSTANASSTGPSEDLQIPALPLKSEMRVREQAAPSSLCSYPHSSPARPPQSGGGPRTVALDGFRHRTDTWVLTHLLPTAWHFGGKSSLLLQHTCPHQSYLGHGGGGGWLGVLPGVSMEWSFYRFICMSVLWWSPGCNESGFTEHSSCPLSKIPLDCSGMTCPLPLPLPVSPRPPPHQDLSLHKMAATPPRQPF